MWMVIDWPVEGIVVEGDELFESMIGIYLTLRGGDNVSYSRGIKSIPRSFESD